MRPIRSLQRVMVVAATAGFLAAVGPVYLKAGYSPDTRTTTATCGNGLIALGPIVIPAAPFTTTVIQCEKTEPHQEVGS